MRLTKRGKLKRQKSLIIFGTFSMLLFFSVGYAAFSTTIRLNAKGNVHPTTTYTVEQLKSTAGTCGNGELVQDPYEAGRFIYRGADPCNYLTLGNDTYRMIAIETDGTLKVIKNDSIGNIVWDPGYSTAISGVTYKSSENGTRTSSTTTDYCFWSFASDGCSVWGGADTMRNSSGILLKDASGDGSAKILKNLSSSTTYDLPKYDSYINVYLNGGKYLTTSSKGNSSTYQNIIGWVDGLSYNSLIATHLFDAGIVTYTSGQTITEDINQAKQYSWQGKIGLISVIDFVKANTNTSLCGTVYSNTYQAGNYSTCKTTNWLVKSTNHMTMTIAQAQYVGSTWGVGSEGYAGPFGVSGESNVYPSFYLISCVKLKGDGTSSNPYKIVTDNTCTNS